MGNGGAGSAAPSVHGMLRKRGSNGSAKRPASRAPTISATPSAHRLITEVINAWTQDGDVAVSWGMKIEGVTAHGAFTVLADVRGVVRVDEDDDDDPEVLTPLVPAPTPVAA